MKGADFMNKRIRFLTKTALIAALYATLTLILAPLSFGILQFRISEVLTVLPMFTFSAVPGLTIGCLLANCIGGMGIADILFGTLATFLAAVCSYLLRQHKWLVPLPTILFNGLIVGGYLYLLYPSEATLMVSMGSVALSETVITYLFGIPVIHFLQRHQHWLWLNDTE